jgi:hypothetical protein
MTDIVTAPPQRPNANEPGATLSNAVRLYHEAGLRPPPVPRELAGGLTELDEWQFASAPVELTDRADFLVRARGADAPAEVGFGHVGHGITSWWLCYRLIHGPLAVFVRIGYGGAYDDHDASGEFFNATVEAIERLMVTAAAAQAAGRIGPAQRLAVVLDRTGGSGWQVLGSAQGWQASDTPFDEAATFLAGMVR